MSQQNKNNSRNARSSEILTGAIIFAIVGVSLFFIKPILGIAIPIQSFSWFTAVGIGEDDALSVVGSTGAVTGAATAVLPEVPTSDATAQALQERNISAVNRVNEREETRDAAYAEERRVERLINEAEAVVWKQALHFFLNTVAYESAVWLASGGEGQSPQFHTKSWGDYLLDVGDQALGLFVEGISDDFLGGLDICEPSLSVKLNIGLGIYRPERAKGPNCSLTEITNNWSSFVTSGEFLNNFSANFDPWNNDIGIALESSAKYDLFVKYQLEAAEKDRQESDGIKAVTDKISNIILTPGSAVRNLFATEINNRADADSAYTGEILADAINTFTSTLAGKLFQRLFKEGLALLSGSDDDGFGTTFSGSFSGQGDLYDPQNSGSVISGRQAASERFTDFYYAGIRKGGGPYKLTEELSICGDINNPGPTECVIDHSLRLAIEQELTVKEALDRDLLDGNAPFGFTSYNQQPRYNEGYPYRSLLILRSHRIVPVTWEITAEMVNKMFSGEFGDFAIQGAVTLNSLVAAYDDEASPFYKLIDPDWVLKAEEVFCTEEGYGPQLSGDFIIDGQRNVSRELYCANFESCIQKDAEGNCIFGYCTEERRVWNLGAESCPARYASCQIFTGRDGGADAYLASTLEYNGCNIDNVGCQWYCRDYNTVSDVWSCTNASERILKSCEVATGCPLAVNCEVDPGNRLCVDDVTGATLTLSQPCSEGSQWWNSTINRCVVGTGCTVGLGGVSCEINGCEDANNILANPSFENTPQAVSEPNKWYVTQGWFTDNSGAPYFQQVNSGYDRVFSGQRAVRFYNSGGPAASAENGVTLRSDPISLRAGTYTFSSQIFNNLNLGQIDVRIVPVDGAQATVTQNILPLRLNSSISRSEWYSLSTDFTFFIADSNDLTEEVQILLNIKGDQVSGTIWFDDFFIASACFVDPVTLALSGTVEKDQSKIHFDRDVLSCDDENDGCSEFVRMQSNIGTNILINPSFELWSNLAGAPDAWQSFGGPSNPGYGTDTRLDNETRFIRDTQTPVVGSQAVGFTHNHIRTDLTFMQPGVGYYVSFWARSNKNTDNGTAAVILWQERHAEGATDPQGAGWARYLNLNYRNDRPEIPLTTEWQRFVLDPFVLPVNADQSTITLQLNHQQSWWSNPLDQSAEVYIDGVQIEAVDFNGDYSDYSDYAGNNVVHLRQAPNYLGCQGYTLERPSPYVLDGVSQAACKGETLIWREDSCNGGFCCHEIDPGECYDYALYCQQDEVGCEGYTPVAGGPTIPGVVSYTDYCPVECVGYDAYRQAATYFETQEEVSYFIPDTAEQCVASAVGCDEFTNLDEVAQGGEGTEYFTYIRHCSKPSEANCQSFFAWQGSDETGFQLQSYSLQAEADGPKLAIENTSSWLDQWGEPSSCDGPEDLLVNPFCRELFGSNGQIYYRILDNTVSCSDNCHPLRKTALGESEEVARANCEASNPAYVSGVSDIANPGWEDGACIYQAIPEEGQRCAAAFVGCREYRGNQSGNVRVAYENTFESGTARGWLEGEISSASLQVGGHSLQSIDRSEREIFPAAYNSITTFFGNMVFTPEQRANSGYDSGFSVCDPDVVPRCDAANGTAQVPCYSPTKNVCIATMPVSPSQTCEVKVGDSGCGALGSILLANKTYTVSFWARTQNRERSQISVGLLGHKSQLITATDAFDLVTLQDISFGDPPGSVEITREWQYFKLGPFRFNSIEPTVAFGINSEAGPGNLNNGFYIDNLRFEEVNDNEYLIKNSWNTPLSCDTNPYTDPPIASPQYMLGCQEYTDTSTQSHTLKSFTRLCREDAIGCEALIDTHNSDSPFAQVFNAVDDVSSVSVPADSVVYMTNRSEFNCSEFNQGCEVVGLPTVNPAGEVTAYESVALINDPDRYDSILCGSDEVGCEEFQSDLGFSYFKDPGQKRCEYRSALGGRRAGWYKIDSSATQPDCPIEASPTGVFHPADNWVGMCPDSYNGCTEYLDPVSDISQNLLFNPDFKQDTNPNVDDGPDGWTPEYLGGGVYQAMYQQVQIKRNTTYTIGLTVDKSLPQGERDAVLNNFRIRMAQTSGLTSIDRTVRVSQSGGQAHICENTYLSNPNDPSAWKVCSPGAPQVPGYTCTANEGACVHSSTLDTTINICRNEFYQNQGNSAGWEACRTDNDCGGGNICVNTGMVCLEDPGQICSLDSHCAGAGNICTARFYDLEWSTYRNDNRNVTGDVTYTGRFHTPDYIVDPTVRVEVVYPFNELDEMQRVIKQVSLRETGIYYGIESTVDTVSCNGVVNPSEGCVLFNDRSEVNYQIGETDTSYLIFDASASSPNFNNGLPTTQCLGACDSNKVINVRPDRVCGQWLECATEYHAVGEGGIEQSYCLDLAVCDQLDEEGNCTNFVSDYRLQPVPGDENQTAVSPEQLKNVTGFTKAGLMSQTAGGDNLSKEGYRHFGNMEQVGEVSYIQNGGFEFFYTTGKPVGWQYATSAVKWQPAFFSTLANTSFTSAVEGVDIREGNGMLRLSAGTDIYREPYAAVSESFEVMPGQNYNFSIDINTLNLKPDNAEFYAYLEGRVAGSANDYTPLASTAVRVSSGLDWKSRLISFNSDNFDLLRVHITHILPVDGTSFGFGECADSDGDEKCDLEGVSYVDNIAIVPALLAQDAPTTVDRNGDGVFDNQNLIAPSCRIYPTQDALACQYVDDQSIFNVGRQGYCLLKDPSDPDVCLQWYPVDLIKGDFVDEFRGYTNRSPLYYCSQMSNTTIPIVVGSTGRRGTNGEDPGIGFWTMTPPVSFGKPSYITVEVLFDGQGTGSLFRFPKLSLNPGNNYEIGWLTEYTDNNNMQYSDYSDGRCAVNQTSAVVDGKSYPCEDNSIYSTYEGCGDEDGGCQQYFTKLPDRLLEQAKNIEAGRDGWSTDDQDGNGLKDIWNGAQRARQATVDYGYCRRNYNNGLDNRKKTISYIKANFDGDDLRNIEYGVCDHTSDSGQFEWQFKFHYQFCEELVEVVTSTGQNKAWFSRLTAGTDYSVPTLDYTYSQDGIPFGAVVNPAPVDDPSAWDAKDDAADNPNSPNDDTLFIGNQPLFVETADTDNFNPPYQARAGSPYSCNNPDGTAPCFLPDRTYIEVSDSDSNGSAQAAERLKRLFAQSYSAWTWNSRNTGIVAGQARLCNPFTPNENSICTVDSDCFNLGDEVISGSCVQRSPQYIRTDKQNLIWSTPQLQCVANRRPATNNEATFTAAVTACNDGDPSNDAACDYCGVAPIVKNITVNNAVDREIELINLRGAAEISLSFNGSVNGSQLPLSQVRVDWGDASISTFSGQQLRDRPNAENPYVFSHSYSYYDLLERDRAESASNNRIYCPDATNNPPAWFNDLGIQVEGRRCYLRPRIQLIDNWGWCNAELNRLGLPVAGNDVWGYVGSACETEQNAWTSYPDYIIVGIE